MRFFAPITVALLAACSHAPAPQEPAPAQPLAYIEVADRLLAMADGGWVVSRSASGLEHLGDSLIWTGIAMGVLDCTRGEIPEAALLKMLAENGNVPYRHPTIPGEFSLDGELGLLFGIVERTNRCPGSSERWAAPLAAHAVALATRPEIPPHFEVALQEALHLVAGAPEPDESARGALGAELAAWSAAVVIAKDSAFRIHLSWLTFRIVPAPKGERAWCGVISRAKMPLLENECNRGGLGSWVSAFQYNAWEYAHQRATWEVPDGRDGLETPALDYLVALWRLGLDH